MGFDQLSLNVGQKYCRMEHSAIRLTFIKLHFVIKIFVLSIFEWPLRTGFTVHVVDPWSLYNSLFPFKSFDLTHVLLVWLCLVPHRGLVGDNVVSW